jgi:hypothetical protein
MKIKEKLRIVLYILVGVFVVSSPLLIAALVTYDKHVDMLAPHAGNIP